mmetsp:Transcript_90767/g.293013  ORF Transcript_90767/g.293013 Transcript_90767/m.293013 type:complete len:221 (-) Transcript_90767:2292-2954(-)
MHALCRKSLTSRHWDVPSSGCHSLVSSPFPKPDSIRLLILRESVGRRPSASSALSGIISGMSAPPIQQEGLSFGCSASSSCIPKSSMMLVCLLPDFMKPIILFFCPSLIESRLRIMQSSSEFDVSDLTLDPFKIGDMTESESLRSKTAATKCSPTWFSSCGIGWKPFMNFSFLLFFFMGTSRASLPSISMVSFAPPPIVMPSKVTPCQPPPRFTVYSEES